MVSGFKRYFKLIQNISNPIAYWQDKISPGKEVVFITRPNPIKIQVPKRLFLIFKEIFLSDVYEVNSLKNELNENSVVIDIGANVGFFSFLVLSKVKVKKIFSFEPIPTNIKIFDQTISENRIVKTHVQLMQAAVTGSEQNEIELFLDGNNELTENASVFSGFESTHSVKVSVPSISLTKILKENNIENVDLLKMDCEGSEFDIIYNTDSSLIKRIRKMIVEVHDVEGDPKNNINHFNSYLQSIGFETEFERLSHRSHILVGTRKQN
jgi:FkbM family methyltransferase